MRHTVLSVILVAVALPAAADALSEIRRTLDRFPANAHFAAAANVQVNTGTEEMSRRGASGFEAEFSAAGFSIRIPAEILDVAEREEAAKKRDPNTPAPTRTAMVALNAFDVIDALDAAAMLRDELSGATLIEQKAAAYNGRQATLVRMNVKPSLASRSRFVNEPTIELTLWLGSDGVPIAAARVSKYSGGFLFLKVGNTRTEHWDLATHGDRLYATRNTQNDDATAAGKHMSNSRTVAYTPK